MKESYSLLLLVLLFFLGYCSPRQPRDHHEDDHFNGVKIDSASRDSIIGVITLGDKFSEGDTISILNQDGSLWYQFSFKYDDSDGVFDFYNEDFNPLLFNPDDYSFALTALSMRDNMCEVLVNEDTRLKKYILVDEKDGIIYKPFPEFLVNVFAVSFDAESNPMRSSIDGPKLQFSKSDNFLLRPLEIKGPWMKIKYEEISTDKEMEGWIKWREGNRIIIQIHSD